MLNMSNRSRTVVYAVLMAAAATSASSANAQRGEEPRGGGAGMGHEMSGEPMRAPRGYSPIQRPAETSNRPTTINRRDYHHNFTAPRAYHIGPYHPPRGYRYQRYGYGQILPRMFWGGDYILSDYWLFGLDLPPVGFEWVRYGPDALLIDIATGEVVQSVYGTFP